MQIIEPFKLEKIPLYKVCTVITVSEGCERGRTILVEGCGYPGGYMVIHGYHCSCYNFDDTKWEATVYNREELVTLMRGWLTTYGGMSEREFAMAVLKYLREENT